MGRDAVQVEGAMRLCTVQEDGHGSDRDVRRDERVEHDLPAGERRKAVRKPVDKRIEHRDQHIHESALRNVT